MCFYVFDYAVPLFTSVFASRFFLYLLRSFVTSFLHPLLRSLFSSLCTLFMSVVRSSLLLSQYLSLLDYLCLS